MTKLIKLLCIIFILSSCNRAMNNKIVAIEPELQPYVDSFINDANRIGYKQLVIDNLIVVFGDLKPNYLAICTRSSGLPPTITFNTKHYAYYKSQGFTVDIEQVMYHELGHCVLGLSHDSRINLKNGYPVSIMNPYHFDISIYKQFKDSYLLNLFFGVTNNFYTPSNP